MTEITVLGSGSSLGVPVVGCDCKTCKSDSPYNKRTRPSILITKNHKNILVDFGPDIRNQLLRENIKSLECAILTHDHADHVSGMDDLRVFSHYVHKPLTIHSDSRTIDLISERYRYMMNEKRIAMEKLPGFDCAVNLAGVDLQFFRQDHKAISSLGIRIKDFVYTNDVIAYPEESLKYLENASCWMIDCMDYTATDAHFGLEQVLFWYEKFKPKQVYLVNMSHNIDYFDIQKQLPENIKPAHDGLKLKL